MLDKDETWYALSDIEICMVKGHGNIVHPHFRNSAFPPLVR